MSRLRASCVGSCGLMTLIAAGIGADLMAEGQLLLSLAVLLPVSALGYLTVLMTREDTPNWALAAGTYASAVVSAVYLYYSWEHYGRQLQAWTGGIAAASQTQDLGALVAAVIKLPAAFVLLAAITLPWQFLYGPLNRFLKKPDA